MEKVASAIGDRNGDGYEQFASAVVAHSMVPRGPLFKTDAAGLWDAYLGNLDEAGRQHYNCHACRHFIERFGGLVFVDAEGCTRSAIWTDVILPEFFRASVAAMRRIVEKARITGVFLSDVATLGTPVTGPWSHLVACCKPVIDPFRRTPAQLMADKVQERAMLDRGLVDFPLAVVRQAAGILETEVLYRSEKVLGVAKWLLDLHERLAQVKNERTRDNLLWVAVATAPPGFCHVRSTMISTLLEDLVAGLDFGAIKARFAEKMHPLQYQRPTAAPSDGNIKQAEKIGAALGAAGSLARRFARLEDVRAAWKPRPEPEVKAEGVFGHLRKGVADRALTLEVVTTMTWEKFARTVLPGAEQIECHVASLGNFAALVTAANPDAPPILQWDRAEDRNPVSWYLYHWGSQAENWGLRSQSWVPVTAICLKPPQWGEKAMEHQGKGIFVLLEGCRDLRYERGAGFFPECLRAEFHGIRATMEAYAKGAVIADADKATACGLMAEGSMWNVALRVRAGGLVTVYKLDRWD